VNTTAPTTEQLQAAFARVRGDGWPATLHELAQAAARYAVVLGAAQALARGQRVLARESQQPAATPTEPPARTFEHPARLTGARPVPRRRHGDHDPKRLAAGDRDD
jgi:hypothetical protein